MACPLRSILNDHDVSPKGPTNRERRLQNTQENDSHHRYTHPSTSHVEKAAIKDVHTSFVLSPQRGDLYHRRKSRSPSSSNAPQIQVDSAAGPQSDDSFGIESEAPPSHEFDFNKFNIFKALLKYPELMHEFSNQLELEDLISLYAISREFHDLANSRFVVFLLGHANQNAPESTDIFKFRCYKHLCQSDPSKRGKVGYDDTVRDVPTFRWLRMVEYRESAVGDIISILAADGLHLPKKASITLKKIWFTMDICENLRRIGLFHNKSFWTNRDLVYATMFFIKLDMKFTDPVDGNGETALRRLMMAQRGLTRLWELLSGSKRFSLYDYLRLWVEWKWVPRLEHWTMEVCGVPARLLCSLQTEGWGRGRSRLAPPDDLVMKESIRREFGMQHYYMDMMLWGHGEAKPVGEVEQEESVRSEDDWYDTADENRVEEDPLAMDPNTFELEA